MTEVVNSGLNSTNHHFPILSYQVQMRISQGWKWKISSVGGVLETVKQAQSHEITFRYSRSKAETQELCEDRRWILCPLFRKKLLIWWSVCGTIKWSPWNIWSTIYQTDHIWWDAHRPRKSPGLLILEHWIIIFGRFFWKALWKYWMSSKKYPCP